MALFTQSSWYRRISNSKERRSRRVKQAYSKAKKAVIVKFQMKTLCAALKYRKETKALVCNARADVEKHGKELAGKDMLVVNCIAELKAAVHLKNAQNWNGKVDLNLAKSDMGKALKIVKRNKLEFVKNQNE